MLKDPHVYFCQSGRRLTLAELCEIELIELRRSVCTYITNHRVGKNPTHYRVKELEFILLAGVLVMIQEREKS